MEVVAESVDVETGSKHEEEEMMAVEGDNGNLFDLEFCDAVRPQEPDRGTITKLAFQCIGVAFGDLGTSTPYAIPGIFQNGIKHDEVLAALSLIFYSIIFITMIKYVCIVLAANDKGEGSEALFADLGHFHIRCIQISTCSVLVPSLLLS